MKKKTKKTMRIIADHIRAATFIISDGIEPSNIEHGYILRRLVRRAIRYGKLIDIKQNFIVQIAKIVIKDFGTDYLHLKENEKKVFNSLQGEENKFGKVIEEGLGKSEKVFNKKTAINHEKYSQLMQFKDKEEFFREFYKSLNKKEDLKKKFDVLVDKEEISRATVSGREAFDLYQNYGFPIEMIIDLVQEKRLLVDIEAYQKELEKHQKISQKSSLGKFKGGLKDQSGQTIKYHTTTHLLHQALRDILGSHVRQVGSNITSERLRFDFNHPEKLTDEEIKKVEDLINEKIKSNLKVEMEELSLNEAKGKGALSFFAQRYDNKVRVYSIGDFSKEVCRGPHVPFSGDIGSVKIIKEKAIGVGRRRIYAQIIEK